MKRLFVNSKFNFPALSLWFAFFGVMFVACVSKEISIIPTNEGSEDDADKLYIVDCLLPGKIKRLGQGVTFVTQRQPAKLAALDCEERGGEYVAYDQANSATALKIWLPAAQKGDVTAQVYVGEIYEKGFNGEKDYKAAALWYQKAAEQGDARAKLNLGNLYEKGLGVEKNMVNALSLYRSASGLRDTDIEFVAAVSSETSPDDILQLKNTLQQERQETIALNSKMKQTEKELLTKKVVLEKEANQLEKEKQDLMKQKTSNSDNKTMIVTLERQLIKREAELEKRRRESKQLSAQLQLYKDEMNVVAANENLKIALAGPSIQMMNPELVNVRGVHKIPIRENSKTREILGRVAAPAGLKNITVNNISTTSDTKGLFKVLLPIKHEKTPVVITAVDTQGKSAKIEFLLTKSTEEKPIKVDNNQVNENEFTGGFGRFHALVIGNNNYSNYAKLDTAVNDAKSIAQMLSENYGFKTTTLVNAKRFLILAALNRLGKKLNENDNLLIYYAGHGELEEVKQLGFWLPVDADKNSRRKWIPNTAISDILSSLPAKRVMVVADSCYSGSLTRSSLASSDPNMSSSERITWLRSMAQSKARMAFTSGGLQPVPDMGHNNHSLFANVLLDILGKNNGILEGQRLYDEVLTKMNFNEQAVKIKQYPEYAPIQHSGHESGEFFFLSRKKG